MGIGRGFKAIFLISCLQEFKKSLLLDEIQFPLVKFRLCCLPLWLFWISNETMFTKCLSSNKYYLHFIALMLLFFSKFNEILLYIKMRIIGTFQNFCKMQTFCRLPDTIMCLDIDSEPSITSSNWSNNAKDLHGIGSLERTKRIRIYWDL